jgi:hypothetical protein
MDQRTQTPTATETAPVRRPNRAQRRAAKQSRQRGMQARPPAMTPKIKLPVGFTPLSRGHLPRRQRGHAASEGNK